MNGTVSHRAGETPEERRDRLSGHVNLITAQLLRSAVWAGSTADRDLVLEYAALNRELGNLSHWADAAWLASVLHERAGEVEKAERVAADVRENQDLARRNVSDLRHKARVTGKYVFLPGRLAALRQRLGRGAAAMFDAVEWAKCRALSDLAAQDRPPAMSALQEALQGARTHYLTLLLDTDRTFAVLVLADGTAVEEVFKIGAAQLLPYADPEKIKPAGRGVASANPFLSEGDWTTVLAPLAGPLDAAFAAKRIKLGDTLLVSPHSLLHLFPLHELALSSMGGLPIGETLTVARVHGAAAVLRCLSTVPTRPSRALVLRAPLADETNDEAYAGGVRRIRDVLSTRLAGEVMLLDGSKATADAVLQTLAPGLLLHLACHGDIFSSGPREERSFLCLSNAGGLPVRSPGHRRPPPGALTPAVVLRHLEGTSAGDRTPLRGGHVTLQACVSGHATANPQGDAVGLEWAFLMAGAASTLGTHWHVDRDDAARFLYVFYDTWLGGDTRVSAWAAAGAALRNKDNDRRWAAFSLTGDWR